MKTEKCMYKNINIFIRKNPHKTIGNIEDQNQNLTSKT